MTPRTTAAQVPSRERGPSHAELTLDHTDRTLLQQFAEAGNKGILSTQITQVLGKRGRGIPIALDEWSRRIGLVTQDGATAFQAFKRHGGRGFRMTEIYLRTAKSMLGVP